MDTIESFRVDHLQLPSGLYLSRTDSVGTEKVLTFDIRMTAPNAEPVMNTAEIHTIEHVGATFLRNHPLYNEYILYFGPMGCRTGFYLMVKQGIAGKDLWLLIRDMFVYVRDYQGTIPGASPKECGNYLDQNLPMAKYHATRFLTVLSSVSDFSFSYPSI